MRVPQAKVAKWAELVAQKAGIAAQAKCPGKSQPTIEVGLVLPGAGSYPSRGTQGARGRAYNVSSMDMGAWTWAWGHGHGCVDMVMATCPWRC